jgi:protein gp37
VSDKSKIEWTDSTWNPVTGCSRVSEGCRNCYAERLAGTRLAQTPRYEGLTRISGGEPKWTGEVRLHEDVLFKPLSWKRPRRIFVNSMGDTFHEKVPFEFIDRMFAVMALCPQHTFQVLTKRPERMAEFLLTRETTVGEWAVATGVLHYGEKRFREMAFKELRWIAEGKSVAPNVWLGTSVENQEEADRRIPHLLNCPAAVRFLSCEPLLGPVDSRAYLETITLFKGDGGRGYRAGRKDVGRIHWVIVGGESGPGARPMEPEWAISLRRQCLSAGVPFFFKQGSSANWPAYKSFESFPPELQVREYPA